MAESTSADINPDESSPRRWWWAAFLSVLAPGLGHVYAGPLAAGIGWMVTYQLLGLYLVCHSVYWPIPRWNMHFMTIVMIGIYLATIVDSIRLCRKSAESFVPRSFNRWYVYLGLAVLTRVMTFAVALIIRAFWVESFHMPSESMADTILAGDRIFCVKLGYGPDDVRRQHVVVFRDASVSESGAPLVKRVVGLPGDVVEWQGGVFTVNGTLLDEPYVTDDPSFYKEMRGRWIGEGRVELLSDQMFVVGDHRHRSCDSRSYGPVKLSSLIGRVRNIYWSFDEESGRYRWDRVGRRIE